MGTLGLAQDTLVEARFKTLVGDGAVKSKKGIKRCPYDINGHQIYILYWYH